MFRLWCEWDFGQDRLVFTSPEAAVFWFNSTVDFSEFEEFESYSGIAQEGYVGVDELQIFSQTA